MDESAPEPRTVLEGFKGFLLWVGGSLAGLTALLYACGYLVARAHLSMLGLYGLVDVGNDYFLQEGAKLVIAVGYNILRTLLALAAVAGVLVFAAMLARRALAASAMGQRLAAWRAQAGRSSWPRYLLFAGLFIALVLHSDHYLRVFEQPLSVANLLYAEPARSPTQAGTGSEIAAWILAGDSQQLDRNFDDILLGAVLAAGLGVLAWRTVSPWSMRVWLVAPFFAALGIYLLTLPMAYGVLQRAARYPLVSVDVEAGVTAHGTALFLLSRTAEAFVLWDAEAHRVIWLPAGSVRRAEVRGVADLFAKARQRAKEERK